VTVISGKNGSGKSAALQALQVALGARVKETGRADKFTNLIRTADTGEEAVLEARVKVRSGDGDLSAYCMLLRHSVCAKVRSIDMFASRQRVALGALQGMPTDSAVSCSPTRGVTYSASVNHVRAPVIAVPGFGWGFRTTALTNKCEVSKGSAAAVQLASENRICGKQ
jgi:hypothetical protein